MELFTRLDKTNLCMIIGLLPATVFGVHNFGVSAFIVILVTVGTAILTEYAYQKLLHKEVTIANLDSAVEGLVLALCLPPTTPWWMCIIGSVFAVFVVKQLFGSVGKVYMNPALGARCFLLLLFTGKMTTYVYEGVTGETPLAVLKAGDYVDLLDTLIGNTAGTIGGTSIIAVLIGVAFLLLMGKIDWKIPTVYIVTFAVMICLFGGHGFDLKNLAIHLCGGGLMLGAWFIATGYEPIFSTRWGKYAYGISLGVFTGIFRLAGSAEESVFYAILLCGAGIPMIEQIITKK